VGFALTGLTLQAACGTTRGAEYARGAASDSASTRRPDGVLIEPAAALPNAQSRAQARGVIALREPAADTAVRELVKSFVEGFEHESLEELLRLLTADAAPLEGRSRGGREVLFRSWRQRMMSVEYSQLAGVEVYRPERIQTAEYDELLAEERPVAPGICS
jgi:hypothetical protein